MPEATYSGEDLHPTLTEKAAADDELVDLVYGVAEGRMSKADVAVFLQAHARK
jgi:hypothetical protein